METVRSKTLVLPLASLPEEDKFSYNACSTHHDSNDSPLRGGSTRRDSAELKLCRTTSPKFNKFPLNKSKVDTKHLAYGTTRIYRRNCTTVITTHKGYNDTTGILVKLQTELDKRFSVLDVRTSSTTLKTIKGKKAILVMKLIEYSATGDERRLEQLFKANCANAQDKKLLVNLEDQYGRTALFYAVYKGNKHKVTLSTV